MIKHQPSLPFRDAKRVMGEFTADLSSPDNVVTIIDEEHGGRYMVVVVCREFPGGFGLIVDRAAVTTLANYFAALADDAR